MASNSSEESQQSFLAGTYTSGDLLFIRAITPLHVGVGRAGGVVDLPVQKDLYGYPIIYASSLKGALRSLCRRILSENECSRLFGSEPSEGETKPGNLMVLDTYPLLIPVRLIKGVYAYVTSPFLLRKFKEYLEVLKVLNEGNKDILNNLLESITKILNKQINYSEALTYKTNKYSINNKIVINEEYWLDIKQYEESKNVIENIVRLLEALKLSNKLGITIEDPRIIIVSDELNVSINIIDRSLIRLTRIRLRTDRKVVKQGGLWTEEYVPYNTVFHTLVLYAASKNGDSYKELFKNSLLSKSKGYIVLGGNETIGRGLSEIRMLGEDY